MAIIVKCVVDDTFFGVPVVHRCDGWIECDGHRLIEWLRKAWMVQIICSVGRVIKCHLCCILTIDDDNL